MSKLYNPDPELDLWYRSDTCTVYLLHASRPIHGAQHYCGSTESMERRMKQHQRVGITWTVARQWKANREFEMYLKRQHNLRRYCPVCHNTVAPEEGSPF